MRISIQHSVHPNLVDAVHRTWPLNTLKYIIFVATVR